MEILFCYQMKKMLCPQCKIAAMYVKNESGERRLVYVTDQAEVIPKNPDETLEGFDVSEVFCLGCSWHGSVTAQVKAGIDLSKLKDIRIEGEDVYLTLPAPFIEIESSEIKHDEVQTSVGLLRSNFTQDEFSQFANRGRRSIEQALPGMGLVEQCQDQARTMLSLMIRKLGKNPVIEVPRYNTEEVKKMIIYKDKQK